MNRAFTLVIIIISLFSLVRPVQAQSVPTFPACPNPGGEVIASYDSGKHGVPGDTSEYDGSDKVFKLNDAQVVQCLCPTSGSGIQTLWWKNPGLTVDEEAVIIKDGWIRIPNGSLWGLDDSVYFAKNSTFNCHGGDTGGPTGGNDDGHVNGASTSSSSGVGGVAGAILGSSTLAATGNWMNIFFAFVIASGAALLARRLYRASR
jgi:hypothetical protein